MPRLLVDVRVDSPDAGRDPSTVLTPVVEAINPRSVEMPSSLGMVFEHAWDEADHVLARPLTAADFQEEAPFNLVEAVQEAPLSSPTVPDAPDLEIPPAPSPTPILEPSHEQTPPPLSSGIEGSGASPALESADQTEILFLERSKGRWRAFGRGMIVGAVALATFVSAVALMQNSRDRELATLRASSLIVTQRAAADVPPAAAPTSTPVAVAPAAALPIPAEAPVEAPAVAPSSEFVVGLTGSLAGSLRYPLADPDGIAFNLPHATSAMKVGTYHPDVPGLRAVWVRALSGGGTHLRFYYTRVRPGPRIELMRTGVRVHSP
jgi:hypothetical protein